MRGSHRPATGISRNIWSVFLLILGVLPPAGAGAQVFDFDSAPIHTSLPIDLTVGEVTAHFSSTGQGFSIQPASTMGFTPVGFGGLCIYPNSVFAADLLIGFSVPLTDFSIMYAPQELGCDDSAIMRVTAYLDGVVAGTATATAPAPGTWPTGTLSYSDPAGFNQVVIHYDRRPTCTDYGPIFMADNMSVTAMSTAVPWPGPGTPRWSVAPNPFREATHVRLQLTHSERITVTFHDVAGRLVRTLVRGAILEPGDRSIAWDGYDEAGGPLRSGVYFCRIGSAWDTRTMPIILRR